LKIEGSTIFVTGGAGFIGSTIVDMLVANGAECVTILDDMERGRLDNLKVAQQSGQINLVRGDICDRELVGELVGEADAVVHLAALRITQCVAEPDRAFDVMFKGAYNVFSTAAKAGVKNIIAASSASVYGAAEEFPILESHHPYNALTLYGVGKLSNEGMLRALRDLFGFRYAVIRPFNVYGPRMDIHGAYTEVLVRWMERIIGGQSPIIFGDGKQTLDFTYVGDVARAFTMALESESFEADVFNAGTGVETSLNEAVNIMLELFESDLGIEYQPPRGVATVPRRIASTAKAAKLLGFRAEVSFAEGLRRLMEWRLAHPETELDAQSF